MEGLCTDNMSTPLFGLIPALGAGSGAFPTGPASCCIIASRFSDYTLSRRPIPGLGGRHADAWRKAEVVLIKSFQKSSKATVDDTVYIRFFPFINDRHG